ncbi:MAG: hypothetical protein WC599_10705 [Bacteroidales bacterium]
MRGISFINDDKGINTALLFDLNELRKAKKNGADVIEVLENLEDLIDYELRVKEPVIPYGKVRKDLVKNGKLKK